MTFKTCLMLLVKRLYFVNSILMESQVMTGSSWERYKPELLLEVKWERFLYSPFGIKQGVRQGGILTASHYKRYNNPLMIDVEDSFTGKRIGTVKILHISVADDASPKIKRKCNVWCQLLNPMLIGNTIQSILQRQSPCSIIQLKVPRSPYMEKRFPSRSRQHILVSSGTPNVIRT